MNLIKQEIKLEKAKLKPDQHYLKLLNSIESMDKLDFEIFSNTGRIIPVDIFINENPNAVISSNCTDVVRYLGGFYIQMLKSGNYIYQFNVEPSTNVQIEHTSLDILELQMWQQNVQEKFLK